MSCLPILLVDQTFWSQKIVNKAKLMILFDKSCPTLPSVSEFVR